MNFKLISALAAAGLMVAAPSFAAVVDFEGVTTLSGVRSYYNGGSDEAGVPGPLDLDITFRNDVLALTNDPSPADPFFTHAPSPGTTMFAFGDDAAMSAIGFDSITFSYSAFQDTSVSLWSLEGGKGTLVGTFNLTANAQNGGCTDSAFCFFQQVTLTGFSGVAHSIQFGSTFMGGQSVALFDDVSVNAVPLPAAGWLLLSALGGLGTIARRRTVAAA